jgi:protein SCO1
VTTAIHAIARVAVCAAAALLLPARAATPLKAGSFTPAHAAPEFSLGGSHDAQLKLSDYRGKVVVLGFGYTSCPDVCPTTLSVLAQARRKLGAPAKDVQVLYVTVDPQRDDAKRMKEYLAAFDPTFVGGTGSEKDVAAVRKQYGVTADKKAFGDSYVVAHSSSTYLIDRAGRLRGLMPYGRSADDYVHDLTILLGDPAEHASR